MELLIYSVIIARWNGSKYETGDFDFYSARLGVHLLNVSSLSGRYHAFKGTVSWDRFQKFWQKVT
jgi:hypothetical protein